MSFVDPLSDAQHNAVFVTWPLFLSYRSKSCRLNLLKRSTFFPIAGCSSNSSLFSSTFSCCTMYIVSISFFFSYYGHPFLPKILSVSHPFSHPPTLISPPTSVRISCFNDAVYKFAAIPCKCPARAAPLEPITDALVVDPFFLLVVGLVGLFLPFGLLTSAP